MLLIWVQVTNGFSIFFSKHLAKRFMLILLVESTEMWLMENRSQSWTWNLNLCAGVEIVPFGSILYGCYLDYLRDILGYFGCLVRMFMRGCYYGYLDVYVWMFMTQTVWNMIGKKSLITFCKFFYDTNNVIFFIPFAIKLIKVGHCKHIYNHVTNM